MSQTHSISEHRRYGIQRVCRVWQLPRSTVYAQRQTPVTSVSTARPGPKPIYSDEALATQIEQVLDDSPFHGEGYRKVWARLRHKGVRTSKERVRRIMREHGWQAPHRPQPARQRPHTGTITTAEPDTMWGTDMTVTVTTGEGRANVFVAVDHCTAECVGIHASRSASRFEALEPIRQGVRECLGGFAEGVACGLSLRHDHGSNYMADDFQNEIKWLGIEPSPSFVRQPQGNGIAEPFIRTLKENLLWVRHFATIEELRQALIAFRHRYNTEWLIERHGYRTPAAYRHALLQASAEAA